MKAILLAAGASQRFVDHGLSASKCLLNPGGQPHDTCLESTSRFLAGALNIPLADQVLVASRTLQDELPWDHDGRRILDGSLYGMQFVDCPRLQPGPAFSALLASGSVDLDEPVVIADTDGYFSPPTESLSFSETVRTSFGLLSSQYTGIKPESLTWVDSLGKVYRPSAMFPIRPGSAANIGVYYFPSWAVYLGSLGQALSFLRDEVTILDVGGNYLRDVTQIQTRWFPCGTPEQFNYTKDLLHGRP